MIPHPIDLNVWAPCDQAQTRALLGLPAVPPLVLFGQSRPAQPPDLGFPIHYSGHLHDDLSLRLLYAAADVFVIPSRQDNLPNTRLEAHACGTPVVAFRTCGLVDIVEERVTGALTDPLILAS